MLKWHHLLLCSSLSLATAAGTITIDLAQPGPELKPAIAGLSQGGGGDSIATAETRRALRGMPTHLVRVEAVTGSHLYHRDGQMDFDRLDAEIEAIRATGGEPIVNFFYTPRELSSQPDTDLWYVSQPRDFDAYARLCADIVRHLNIERRYAVKYFEFWNEPSGNFFWQGWGEDPSSLHRQYEAVARAVKAVDPTALLGIMADNGAYLSHYEAFYQYATEHAVPVDFITLHWYTEWDAERAYDPARLGQQAREANAQFKRFFNREPAALFFTEWGVIGESVNQFQAETVAAYLAAALTTMQQTPEIDGACYFRILPYRDPSSSLFDSEYQPRIAWRILNFFNTLPHQTVAAASDNPTLSVLAAHRDREMRALLARYDQTSEQPEEVLVTIHGLQPDRRYRVSCAMEDATTAGIVGAATAASTATMSSDQSGTLTLPVRFQPMAAALLEVIEL